MYKIVLCYGAASLNSLDAFNNVVLDFPGSTLGASAPNSS